MSRRLLVATRKGLFTYEQRGTGKWEIVKDVDFLAAPVTMVLPDSRDGALYAGLNHGHFGVKLHRSDDGKTWKELPAPLYPPKPEDYEEPPSMMGTVTPWKLIQIWSLEGAGPDKPGSLWCGTIPGGLFRSDDRGESWQLVESLWNHPGRREWFGGGADHPGIHSICVDPRDSSHVFAGVSCGGVWETTDGGDSWKNSSKGMWAAYMPPEHKENVNVQDPHLIAQSRSDPNVLWSQHHNGVFMTTNGAESWEEITDVPPSNFGFAVAIHPNDSSTVWTVPAVKDECRVPVDGALAVARTRDGGKSFEAMRNGLPQKDAYDLIYRHGLSVTPDGDTLAIGSTTGGLWISENQGDNWTCVSTNLPPIYQVRFQG